MKHTQDTQRENMEEKRFLHTIKCQNCDNRFKICLKFKNKHKSESEILSLLKEIDITIRPDTKQWEKMTVINYFDTTLIGFIQAFWKMNRTKYMRATYGTANKMSKQKKLLCNKCYYREVNTDKLLR